MYLSVINCAFSMCSMMCGNSFRMSCTQFVRSLSCYKKVPRIDDFKIISRPDFVPTSLGEHLSMRIRAGGPISVADYMRAVLTYPNAGYYMKGDVIGRQGDFITSPEISQLFGEMIGIWACHELSKIGSPRPMQIIELGPGKGTLAADVLRVLCQFSPGIAGLSLHLVEVSDRLAEVQARKLALTDLSTNLSEPSPFYQEGVTEAGFHVYWYKDLKNVPKAFSFIVAHEFFDALPIHKFQKIDGKWKEVLVTTKEETGESPSFDFVLSRVDNPPQSLLIDENETREHVEVCPEAAVILRNVADRLVEDGGISLIIDYGHLGTKEDTFRGFKKHQLHNPLDSPGSADLTADVDFSFLSRVVADKTFSVGPTTQRSFLQRLGAYKRLEVLLSKAHPDQVENLRSGYNMIVDDMGERFLCWALFPSVLKDHLARFPVSGFYDRQADSK